MAGIKIHQYPLERTSIGDEDYYDIDYWTGSSYQSAKIKGSTLKNVLGANYIDITAFISGYELTDKDAGKLITNSNANVRTLVIPSGLALPNNMVSVKGRIAIQPETGVNITLPDGSVITDPAQFTCVADEVYILHKSAFSGDDYILVSLKKSENISTNDLIITDTIRELQVATDGTLQIVTNDANNSAIFRVGENSNERFSEIEFNTVIFDLLSKFQNPSITAGVIVEVNPNEFKFIVLPDTSNTSVYHGLIKADANKTIIEKSNAGKFMFDSSLSINTFEDLRATKKGLEYSADYSANFSVRSLVDKGYVDSGLSLKLNIADAYGGKRYTLIKPNGTKEFYDNLTQVRSNWADGDVLHQFADETDITYVDNGSGYMYTLPNLHWIGNGFSVKVSNILVSGEAYFLPIGKTAYLSNVKLGGQGANASTVMLVNGTLYGDDNTFISIDIENNKSSSVCLNLAGTMYGGNVIANGDGESATLPQGGISGAGTCINVNTRGFQSGSLTNFFGGSTTYSVATNYRNVYCNFGNQQIGNGKTFDHCYIYSTRNNNGANQSVFVARNCTIIHVPASNLNTFYNIAAITMIDCVFISAGYLCASFGSAGPNLIQGGYHSFANQTNYGAHNYSSLLTIIDCTIEATNASATTDVLLLNNSNATNVKINNVTFKNASGRSDIRTIPANNVEWKNCRFSKGSAHISVSSGTVADAYNNNPARLTDPKGFLNNTGNGNWFMYVPMTTGERDLLTSVSAGFVIRNTTTNFLQVYNGSTWKDLLDLT